MRVEILIRKETTLVEHLCIFDESTKQPTRSRLKKLLARHFPDFWKYYTKDDNGHYHTLKSGPRHCWYFMEIIPCT